MPPSNSTASIVIWPPPIATLSCFYRVHCILQLLCWRPLVGRKAKGRTLRSGPSAFRRVVQFDSGAAVTIVGVAVIAAGFAAASDAAAVFAGVTPFKRATCWQFRTWF
jgi:hypothetical protein